jgi:hypothetical protein
MRRLLIFTGLLVLLGCGQSQNRQLTKPEVMQEDSPGSETASDPAISTVTVQCLDIDQEFLEITSILQVLNLPVYFYCGVDSAPWAADLGDAIAAMAPAASMVAGMLPRKNNNTYIIYAKVGDILYPYLYTYDRNGHAIDSISLHIGYCAGDAGEIAVTTVRINADFSINMIDTLRFLDTTRFVSWKDPVYLDSIIIKERKMKLNTKGIYYIYNEQQYHIDIDSSVLVGRYRSSYLQY